MIITVTLNAAIDKSLSVPNFRLGRRHRTVEQRTMAGGKGVNIARTLKTLGQPVIATGFAGGITGTHIVEQLTEEAILNDFVRIREESRTNTSVLDPTTGEQTEINERGPSVSQHEVELFREKLLYLARGAAIVVFAGSLPRGLEPDFYAVLIRELERTGVTTVIDTEGEPLHQAVRAEPDVVSPNVIEAEELVGHEFASEQERSLGVREIAALGPHEAIMTLPDGCFAQVLVDGQPCMRRVSVEVRESIAKRGSGDAFLHVSVVERSGQASVPPGATLEVRAGPGQKGPQVTEIISVDASTASQEQPRRPRPECPEFPRADRATVEELGTVKWYNATKGFGFIASDRGGKDIFVHVSALQRAAIMDLSEGQRVAVDVADGQKGPEAVSLRPI